MRGAFHTTTSISARVVPENAKNESNATGNAANHLLDANVICGYALTVASPFGISCDMKRFIVAAVILMNNPENIIPSTFNVKFNSSFLRAHLANKDNIAKSQNISEGLKASRYRLF